MSDENQNIETEVTEEEVVTLTVEDYVRSLSPNASVSDNTIQCVLADAGITAGTGVTELTEKQKDLALAYLLVRIALNPVTSQRVTDRDADWEHSEGSEQWGRSQLQQFLLLARDLLSKWGIKDPRVESLAPKWGMKGTGFRKIRRYL